jgi:hypothetical protein
MERSKLTLALASLGVIGLAASHQASAAITTAGSGNGDLVLVVTDAVTGESYYNNLNILAAPGASIASFTATPSDSLYAQFKTDVGSDTVNYAVIGGSDASGASNPVLVGGKNWSSFDSTIGGSAATGVVPGTIINGNITAAEALMDQNIVGPLNGLNGTVQNSGNGYLVSTNATKSPINNTLVYTDASGLTTWNGNTSFVTDAAVGTAQDFYNYTAAKGFTNIGVTPALIGSATFDGTTLTYTAGVSSVPLPPAVWLFGSGLLGLIGIGRRRAAV